MFSFILKYFVWSFTFISQSNNMKQDIIFYYKLFFMELKGKNTLIFLKHFFFFSFYVQFTITFEFNCNLFFYSFSFIPSFSLYPFLSFFYPFPRLNTFNFYYSNSWIILLLGELLLKLLLISFFIRFSFFF
jgi:hypothetical protein